MMIMPLRRIYGCYMQTKSIDGKMYVFVCGNDFAQYAYFYVIEVKIIDIRVLGNTNSQ